MAPTLRRCPFCGGEVYAREVIIIGGTEEFEIRHRDEDAAYRDNCPMLVGLYPSEGELVAAWNCSKYAYKYILLIGGHYMAERRMFAKTIVESDAFLDMPLSAQSLYIHLGMNADDWGFVNNPRSIRRMCGASEDDLRLLVAKKFILTFDSGAAVIKSWWVNNYVRSDRRHATRYPDELATLYIDENKSYTTRDTGLPADMFKPVAKVDTLGSQLVDKLEPPDCQLVDKVDTEVRLGKVRLGESTSNSSRVDTQPNPKGFGACAPEQPKKRRAKKFVKPSIPEVDEYAEGFIKSRNLRLTGETFRAERFVSWYDANGWKVGKNPMKDWKGAVRTWIFKDYVDDSATATAADAKSLDAFDFAGTL